MRDRRLLVVVTLILNAACTGSAVGSAAIENQVNHNCDGRPSLFTLDVSYRTPTAPTLL